MYWHVAGQQVRTCVQDSRVVRHPQGKEMTAAPQDQFVCQHANQLAVKTPTLPLSSEFPAQAESAKRAVAYGATSYSSYC